jgi:hypothetical protein
MGILSTSAAGQSGPKGEAPRLPLILLPQSLAICRLAPESAIPAWASGHARFLSISRTEAELSLVASQTEIPADVQCERDYRALRVRGPLPLDLVGILASIANPLAEAGLSIFAISTYDTDYVLVKAANLDSAVAVLHRAGHSITEEEPGSAPETPMNLHATGTFEVKLAPQTGYSDSVGRMSIDKQFLGDLTGSSVGEMLAVMSSVEGSAGYVAMERVTGTLKGRSGSFALQHSGLMNRGEPTLTVTVVPDSGTDQLTGLAGTMKIIVEGKTHSYEFVYTLPAAP